MNELSGFKWFLVNGLTNFHEIICEIQKKDVNPQDLNIKTIM